MVITKKAKVKITKTFYIFFDNCIKWLGCIRICWYSKKYTQANLLIYKDKIVLTNNFGGQLYPALYKCICWSNFLKYGIRASFKSWPIPPELKHLE